MELKLKTRIKIAIITILATVLALNTLIILFYISDSLKRNSEHAMQSINQQKMITFENLMDNFVTLTQKPLIDDSILEILRKDYTKFPEENRRFIQYQDYDTMDERLYTEMFYKNEYIYAVTIFLEDDNRIYSKQRSGKGVLEMDYHKLSWYCQLQNTPGTEALVFPYMGEDIYRGNEPIIAIGRLLKDPLTNHVLGVIRVDIAVKDLKNIFESSIPGESSEVLFQDDKDNLLYTSLDIDNWETELEKELKIDSAVTTISEKYGFSITTLLPKNKLYKKVYDTILIIVCITIGCIILALIFVEFTVKKSLLPIGNLNNLMKEVRKGDLSVRAPVQGVGEFEEVCDSFNLMVSDMDHLIKRIRLEETEKMEAEYKALQAQISPHFIMNTMNTIKWMAVIQGNRLIEKAIDAFSHLLSFVVRERDEKILISTELKQMQYYTDILSLRYYNKFNINFSVEDSVKQCYTIKFLLQTLVENSVFHAFGEMTEGGVIQIRIGRKEGVIVYEVEDNGKGIPPERIEEILNHDQEEKRGMVKIGIRNIDQRIKLIFGQKFGVSIESYVGKYTIVRVIIPVLEEKESENNCC